MTQKIYDPVMVESLVAGNPPIQGLKVVLVTKSLVPIGVEVGVFMQNGLPDIVRWGDRLFVRQSDSHYYTEGYACTATNIVEVK